MKVKLLSYIHPDKHKPLGHACLHAVIECCHWLQCSATITLEACACATGVAVYEKWSKINTMFTSIPGWNVDEDGNRTHDMATEEQDLSLVTLVKYLRNKNKNK